MRKDGQVLEPELALQFDKLLANLVGSADEPRSLGDRFLQARNATVDPRLALLVGVGLAPAVWPEKAPELVVAWSRQAHRPLVGIGDHQVHHALTILALAKTDAVVALHQVGVLLPAAFEHATVLIPEHCFVALAGDVVGC